MRMRHQRTTYEPALQVDYNKTPILFERILCMCHQATIYAVARKLKKNQARTETVGECTPKLDNFSYNRLKIIK